MGALARASGAGALAGVAASGVAGASGAAGACGVALAAGVGATGAGTAGEVGAVGAVWARTPTGIKAGSSASAALRSNRPTARFGAGARDGGGVGRAAGGVIGMGRV